MTTTLTTLLLAIIALTANAVSEAKEKFTKAGMDDFVAKPIEMKEICNCIKKWLPRKLVLKTTDGTKEKETEIKTQEISNFL